jgi:hypothetical protein
VILDSSRDGAWKQIVIARYIIIGRKQYISSETTNHTVVAVQIRPVARCVVAILCVFSFLLGAALFHLSSRTGIDDDIRRRRRLLGSGSRGLRLPWLMLVLLRALLSLRPLSFVIRK